MIFYIAIFLLKIKDYFLLIFFISLMLSISGFISFETVPCRLSRS